jgi:hypothetical protein
MKKENGVKLLYGHGVAEKGPKSRPCTQMRLQVCDWLGSKEEQDFHFMGRVCLGSRNDFQTAGGGTGDNRRGRRFLT